MATLEADWQAELEAWLAPFLARLRRVEQRRWAPVYGDAGYRRPWVDKLYRDYSLTGIPDGLLAELAERGLKVDYRTMWEFVHAEKLSYKKDADCCRAGSSRCRPSASAVDQVSGSD